MAVGLWTSLVLSCVERYLTGSQRVEVAGAGRTWTT